uniref:Cyclin G1 n=1 Tax=Capra hircus TaxID=9925 RepID=A0A8C2NJ29_CAPHI
MRMEKIVLEKVCWKVKATTAFQFLQLYYSLLQENVPHERSSLNFERLEAQLKACYCRIIFSKAKPSVLALSIIALEIQAQKYIELTEGVERLQKHSKDDYSNKKLLKPFSTILSCGFHNIITDLSCEASKHHN